MIWKAFCVCAAALVVVTVSSSGAQAWCWAEAELAQEQSYHRQAQNRMNENLQELGRLKDDPSEGLAGIENEVLLLAKYWAEEYMRVQEQIYKGQDGAHVVPPTFMTPESLRVVDGSSVASAERFGNIFGNNSGGSLRHLHESARASDLAEQDAFLSMSDTLKLISAYNRALSARNIPVRQNFAYANSLNAILLVKLTETERLIARLCEVEARAAIYRSGRR
jgi:hypothetical protein